MNKTAKISVRNLFFKIFGDDPQSVLPMLHDGIDKAEIQKKTGHVIGLNNINIDIEPGLITVIMGFVGIWQINPDPPSQPSDRTHCR